MKLTLSYEFPPLLQPGLHIFSLSDVRKLCVEPFTNSKTREKIMLGLEYIIAEIERVLIESDVWVNGSFITEKLNPNDSDIVIKIDANLIDNGTADQRQVLECLKSNLSNDYLCDSYIMPIYPDGDPSAVLNDYNIAYWLKQFGFSRNVNYKGIAVVKTGMKT